MGRRISPSRYASARPVRGGNRRRCQSTQAFADPRRTSAVPNWTSVAPGWTSAPPGTPIETRQSTIHNRPKPPPSLDGRLLKTACMGGAVCPILQTPDGKRATKPPSTRWGKRGRHQPNRAPRDKKNGTWRSPVAHQAGGLGVVGSNPAVPTQVRLLSRSRAFFFSRISRSLEGWGIATNALPIGLRCDDAREYVLSPPASSAGSVTWGERQREGDRHPPSYVAGPCRPHPVPLPSRERGFVRSRRRVDRPSRLRGDPSSLR